MKIVESMFQKTCQKKIWFGKKNLKKRVSCLGVRSKKNNHKIDNGFVCLTLSTAEKSECEVTLHDIQINELALAFSATLG